MRCPDCDGNGRCVKCNGTGFAPCGPCDGEGALSITLSTGATGSNICPFCNGHGVIRCEPICQKCGGSGEIPHEELERQKILSRYLAHSDCVSWKILAVNLILFIAGAVSLLIFNKDYVLRLCALNGTRVFAGEWWRMITSMFVHIGFYHFIINMIVLLVYCPPIEETLGAPKFLSLYFFSGTVGNVLTILMKPQMWSAGASGALFGVLGAYLGIQSRYRIFQRDYVMKLAILMSLDLLMGFLPGMRINVLAHLGGLAGGFILSSLLRLDESTEQESPEASR